MSPIDEEKLPPKIREALGIRCKYCGKSMRESAAFASAFGKEWAYTHCEEGGRQHSFIGGKGLDFGRPKT